MNSTLAAFDFAKDYNLEVIEADQQSTEDLTTLYDRVSYTAPTYIVPPGNVHFSELVCFAEIGNCASGFDYRPNVCTVCVR